MPNEERPCSTCGLRSRFQKLTTDRTSVTCSDSVACAERVIAHRKKLNAVSNECTTSGGETERSDGTELRSEDRRVPAHGSDSDNGPSNPSTARGRSVRLLEQCPSEAKAVVDVPAPLLEVVSAATALRELETRSRVSARERHATTVRLYQALDALPTLAARTNEASLRKEMGAEEIRLRHEIFMMRPAEVSRRLLEELLAKQHPEYASLTNEISRLQAFIEMLVDKEIITQNPDEATKCCGIKRDENGFCQHHSSHPIYFNIQNG